jgi:hypothetical protein
MIHLTNELQLHKHRKWKRDFRRKPNMHFISTLKHRLGSFSIFITIKAVKTMGAKHMKSILTHPVGKHLP